MVKAPINNYSWKSSVLKVEIAAGGNVSTAAPADAPKMVRLAPRSIQIGRPVGLNLESINRHLRGKKDPVLNSTAERLERETA